MIRRVGRALVLELRALAWERVGRGARSTATAAAVLLLLFPDLEGRTR